MWQGVLGGGGPHVEMPNSGFGRVYRDMRAEGQRVFTITYSLFIHPSCLLRIRYGKCAPVQVLRHGADLGEFMSTLAFLLPANQLYHRRM